MADRDQNWILACGVADAIAKSTITGIGDVRINSSGTGLVFTNKFDNSVFEVILPGFHTHSNLSSILEKFTKDSNGNLLFDGEQLVTYEDLVAGKNIKIEKDSTTGKITISSTGGSGSGGNLGQDITSSISVGGISANTKFTQGTSYDDMWDALLNPYQKPTVAIALNPNKTLYEKGVDTINSITISVTVTKKSANITDVEIYDGSTLIATLPVNLTSGSKTVSYTYSCNITTDTTFKAIAKDGKQNGEATAKIEFINPMYRGLLGSGTTKVMQKKGNYTYNNITCTNDAVVFKYDSSYGNLTSIIDANNFENINSFTKSTETINGVTYNVYTSGLATLNNFSYTFKF